MQEYPSDREIAPQPRTQQEVSLAVWRGIWRLLEGRIRDSAFGQSFPEMCPDCRGICGCNDAAFWEIAEAELPGLSLVRESPGWPNFAESFGPRPPASFARPRPSASNFVGPIRPQPSPKNVAIPSFSLLALDLIQFAARHVAKPIQADFHSYFGHHHFRFDRQTGLEEFINDVNRIFARNGVAYELQPDGVVSRIAPPLLHDTLKSAIFCTGDYEVDRLLESARNRFFHPNVAERRVGLEHLWDAFERVKTLEPGRDKVAQISALLNRSSSGLFLKYLDVEGRNITKAGNSFRIRHSETSQNEFATQEEADYFNFRAFAWIYFVLKRTNRAR